MPSSKHLRLPLMTICIAAMSLTHCLRPSKGAQVLGLSTSTADIWQKTSISVCFDRGRAYIEGNGDPKKFEKTVADAAKAAFTIEATGVEFTGFGDCQTSGGADVGFIFDDRTDGAITSRVGTKNFLTDADMAKNFAGVQGPAVKLSALALLKESFTIAPEAVIAEVALHELGHILGLFHEHAHPASTCRLAESAIESRAMLGADTYLDHGLAYDPYSIMSYCGIAAAIGMVNAQATSNNRFDASLDYGKVRQGLSEGDRALIKKLYTGGYAGEVIPAVGPRSTPAPTTAGSGGAPNGYPYCPSASDKDSGGGWSWDVGVTDPKGTHSCVIKGSSADK